MSKCPTSPGVSFRELRDKDFIDTPSPCLVASAVLSWLRFDRLSQLARFFLFFRPSCNAPLGKCLFGRGELLGERERLARGTSLAMPKIGSTKEVDLDCKRATSAATLSARSRATSYDSGINSGGSVGSCKAAMRLAAVLLSDLQCLAAALLKRRCPKHCASNFCRPSTGK